jgi:signal transduction histidine kinase
VGALVAAATCFAAEPAVVRSQDPRLLVERFARRLDWRDGLPGSYLSGAVQDRDGFLWVAGPEGISRYDGVTFKTVYPRGSSFVSGCTESGRVVFWSEGRLREVRGESAVTLTAPPDGSGADWSAAIAGDGSIWWRVGPRLWRLDASGSWNEVPSPAPASDPARLVNAGRGPHVFVANRGTLWSLAPGEAARELARIRGIGAVIERADGSIVAAANQPPGPVTTRAFEIRDGATRLIFERQNAKLSGLTERGPRVWIATDQGLSGIAEGASPLTVTLAETFFAAGSIFVDREGSLWMATFRGLVHLPEPETYAASFVKVSRTLAHVGRRTCLSAWGELASFEDTPEGLQARSIGLNYGIVCADASGRVWAQGAHGISVVGETGLIPGGGDAENGELLACTTAPSGTTWMTFTGRQILALRPGDRAPRDVHATFPLDVDRFDRIREDAAGMLWAVADRRVCRTPASEVLHGGATPWTCEDVPGDGEIFDIQAMPSGDVWLATSNGVVRRENGIWTQLGACAALRSRWLLSIRPSPSGGAWLMAMGGLTRVVERPGTPEGFEVVEELSAWHGVPTLNGSDAAEDPDGTVWFATDAGLMKVTSEVRRTRPKPPLVALIEASADGHSLPAGGTADLPYRRNRLELRFAALSYRDPMAIRYRHRLRDDEPWSEPTTSSLFRFVDLAPGKYRVAVEASVDGKEWSPAPAGVAFRVLKPWYLQPAFFAAAAASLAAALALLYRMRVRSLLRLERQRTRIAMDLHDEVGSGLGTISVLAGLVAQQEVAPEKRHEFASRIASVSRELSQALGDIVWSLRPGSGTLDAAWNQIVDRARPLFASGAPSLEIDAPAGVPPLPLSVVARRALFLIAVEALHNAARHSGATRVTLRLAHAGSEWILSVEDDGRGMSTTPTTGRRGLGLDGMRARAAEMRASIAWEQREREGTRVTLRFRPEAD